VISLGSMDGAEVLAYAAALEKHSEHPIAAAIVRAAKENVSAHSVREFKSLTGAGVTGKVNYRDVAVGNVRLMREIGVSGEVGRRTPESVRQGTATELYVAIDHRIAGVIVLSDSLRPTSRDAVRELEGMGIQVTLLTGDRRPSAESVAKAIGVNNVIAEVLPEGKVDEIRRLQGDGRVVAMVGDGINDAPALAQSDVGISMPKGTDIAIEASDIALMRSDLRGVPAAISLSRQAMAIMKQNLFWAFVYNVIGIPIAAGVLYPITGVMLSPVIASAAMALSSISVVGNSLRLRHARVGRPSGEKS
jgi:P-type Cu+ transporter